MLIEGIEFKYPQNINVVGQVATIVNEQWFFQTEAPDLNASVLFRSLQLGSAFRPK